MSDTNMNPLPGPAGDARQQVEGLLREARAHFAHRNSRKTVDALHAAQRTAAQHGLHAEASQLRRALTILASGGRPKLLGRGELRQGGNATHAGDE